MRRRIEERHFAATPARSPQRVEHGSVLGCHAHQVPAAARLALADAADRQIVGLGGSAGKDDLLRLSPDCRRDRLAGRIRCRLGFPTIGMVDAAGVAEPLREIRQHRLQHARV